LSVSSEIFGQEASDLATNLFAFSCDNRPFGTCLAVEFVAFGKLALI
jgi:hypothetical protein